MSDAADLDTLKGFMKEPHKATCQHSVIASGPSVWMPLDERFHNSISNVAILMASIQRDAMLIRITLVPGVHPIIVYTLATEA